MCAGFNSRGSARIRTHTRARARTLFSCRAQYCRRLMTVLRRRVCLRFTRRINFDLPRHCSPNAISAGRIRGERKKRTSYTRSPRAIFHQQRRTNLSIKFAFFYELLDKISRHRGELFFISIILSQADIFCNVEKKPFLSLKKNKFRKFVALLFFFSGVSINFHVYFCK